MPLHGSEEGAGGTLLRDSPPSCPAPASSSGTPPKRTTPLRRWKARALSPGCLIAVGAALLAVGAALVATPLALHAAGAGAPPPPPPASEQQPGGSGLDPEGVPLDAVPSGQQQEGQLIDCASGLANRSAYESAAAAAEASLFGGPAADLPAEQLQARVAGLPPLLFGTVFWVLASGSHPYAAEFPAAAAAQVEALNVAFKGLNISFQLDAVVAAPAASDAAITDCPAHWQELAAQLLPGAGLGGSLGSSSSGSRNGSGTSSSSSSVADPQAIHIIVCKPPGVRGASWVLGDGPAPAEGGAASGAILLRRSALWLSRTSLVHQIGHFLGLPHPFPDEKQTCKLDGDGVADTPLQYAPNHACEPVDAEDDLHVCSWSGDGPVPTINFMDLTNDTCRYHFTTGQVARMQSMLRALRPSLFAAASAAAAAAAPQPRHPLTFEAAWQSGPPAVSMQRRQAEALAQEQQAAALAAAAASGGTAAVVNSSSASGDAAAIAQQFADPWGQAALAADGLQSSAVQDCACLGPDAAGSAFWTGQLNASYSVGAVQLLLPPTLSIPGGGSGDGPPAPEPAVVAAAGPAPDAATAAGVVSLEVWVGDSLDHARNQRCVPGGAAANGSDPQPTSLQLSQALHTITCQPPVTGRFVSVVLATSAEGQQQQQPLCLCEVRPLTLLAPALPASPAAAAAAAASRTWRPLPAVPLNVSSDAVASQPGGRAGQGAAKLAAARALAPWSERLGAPACSPGSSNSSSKGPAWWSLDTGLDGSWVRGLRLSVPWACQPGSGGGTGAVLDCRPAAAANLTVLVGDLPPSELFSGDGSLQAAKAAGSVCAAGVAAPGGQPVLADCGRLMHGRYVTVASAAAAGQPLSLCGLRLLGALELLPGEHMQRSPEGGLLPQAVAPPELQPLFAAAMDGDPGTCLDAPPPDGQQQRQAGKASWQLQLDGSYSLLAVRLAARAAAGGNASGLAVSLLDAGGAEVASWQPANGSSSGGGGSGGSGNSSSSSSLVWELPAPLLAAAFRVQGFASLCEVQLLAASLQPVPSYQLQPTDQWRVAPGRGSSLAAVPAGGGSGSNGSGSNPASSLLDGDPLTCLRVEGAAGNGSAGGGLAAQVEVLLGRPHWLHSVRLVGGGILPQAVSLAGSLAHCRPTVGLQPWQPATASCPVKPLLLTDRLLITAVALDGGSAAGAGSAGAAAQPLVLCDLQLFGLPSEP